MSISHNLIQGSAEWHAFRSTHFGASEASAMLGLSPHKSRTQLLNEKKTGLAPEVNAATQAIFNKGHEVEALARPIVEKIIDDGLSPMTYSSGNLSASCDGITFMGDIAWENKQFNAAHYEQVKNGELPEIHWPQCQQVLYCTDAEKLFFTISDGTEERTVGVWVYPNVEQQQTLVAGWDQFEKDLSSHEVKEVKQAPKAQAILALPTLAIAIRGEVTLSNLPEFKEAATAFISNINTDLITDEDFANAEANVKFCKDAEDNIEATKKSAIAQTASIDDLMRALDFISDQLRDKRLDLDKKVKSEKENRKLAIINTARAEFDKHLNSHLPVKLSVDCPIFAEAIKGKKTLTSMQEAVNTMLLHTKIALDELARDIGRKTTWFNDAAKGFETLFPDFELIKYKPSEDFQLLVSSRIAEHQRATAAREASIGERAKHVADAGKVMLSHEEAKPVAEVKSMQPTADRPSCDDIIRVIADYYKVDEFDAKQWLMQSFGELRAA